jgi:hypothetical protein
VAYALDRLGWLQFEQLCSRLLELDSGVPAHAWAGGADQCRHVLCGASLGPPLLRYELPGPVLVHSAWIRPGGGTDAGEMVDRLAREHPEDLEVARSYLLVCNGELEEPLEAAVGDARLRIGILGKRELSERIDARADLRRAMPSLLGLRALEELIGEGPAAASTLDRHAAAELAVVFVPTRAHARTLTVLGEHRFAVLTGPPEMGKTAIARTIALAQMTAGWEAHECTTPEDVWQAFNPGRPQVFIADDAFGSTEYRADAAERWAREMERLLRSLDDRHWLIWTSRPAPLQAGLRRLHRERGAERFPSPARVLVDAGDLDQMEKTLILLRHAKAAELPVRARRALRHHGPAIVSNEHFTPERIRRLVGRLRGGETDVASAADQELRTPSDAMAVSFSTLGTEHRDLLRALLDTPPGPAVTERELVSSLRRHHDGSLSHHPIELVDRLSDHFLKVLS